MSSTMHASFNLPTSADLLKRLNLEPGGKVQLAIDNEVIRWSELYAPFDTGTLAHSPYANRPPEGGKVIYRTPYARYQWYGKVMGPNIPVFDDDSGVPTRFFSPKGQKKHLTGKDLTYRKNKNPEAGPFWALRMKAHHMKDIVEVAKRYVGI